jgi:hypothetical protein
MFVAALEAVPGVAEHQRARSQQSTAKRRAVLKGSCQNDGDNVAVMFLFERAIVWATGAYHVCHRPAVAAREHPWQRLAGLAVLSTVCQRTIQFDRNFCQDPFSACVL